MGYARLTLGFVAGCGALLALTTMQPAGAAPGASGAALKSAVASDVIEASHWRRRRGWIAGGFATGLAIGAIAGSRPYYYDPYYYGPPTAYYVPPAAVYPEPYPDPNGPVRQCWVPTDPDRGYGYYRPC